MLDESSSLLRPWLSFPGSGGNVDNWGYTRTLLAVPGDSEVDRRSGEWNIVGAWLEGDGEVNVDKNLNVLVKVEADDDVENEREDVGGDKEGVVKDDVEVDVERVVEADVDDGTTDDEIIFALYKT